MIFSFSNSLQNFFFSYSLNTQPLNAIEKFLPHTTTQPINFNNIDYSASQLKSSISKLSNDLENVIPTLYSKSFDSKTNSPLDTEIQNNVAIVLPNSPEFVVSLLATFQCGKCAIPLSPNMPLKSLTYYLEDSKATCLMTTPGILSQLPDSILPPITIKISSIDEYTIHQHRDIVFDDLSDLEQASGSESDSPSPLLEQTTTHPNSLIIYTSGTTGSPKGVVHTTKSLDAMIQNLASWEISKNDRILHFLPVNHVHGLVNALLLPLSCGSTVEIVSEFHAESILNRCIQGMTREKPQLSLLMGVPTIYSRLLGVMKKKILSSDWKSVFQQFRVLISGSDSLQPRLFNSWYEETGHYLLERYGMSELGMVLSNPLHGERKPRTVGKPLPLSQIKVDPDGHLLVKGDICFSHYWRKPLATIESFSTDGWFLTGDIVSINENDSYFSIEGRESVDIIKSAGYKIGSNHIQAVLNDISGKIEDDNTSFEFSVLRCVVLGIPDSVLGQRTACLIKFDGLPKHLWSKGLEQVFRKARGLLNPYEVPRLWKAIDTLPTSGPMKKINKIQLRSLFTQKDDQVYEFSHIIHGE